MKSPGAGEWGWRWRRGAYSGAPKSGDASWVAGVTGDGQAFGGPETFDRAPPVRNGSCGRTYASGNWRGRAKARLVIELDGPVHRMDGRQADLARQADLESRGLLVVRFDNDQVLCQLEETLYQLRSLIWSRLVAHEQ